MVVDISWISYYAPIWAFFIVLIVVYAVLLKTQVLGENHWIMFLVSFFVATVFISAVGLRSYVLDIIPWFAALIVSLFLLLALMGFAGSVDFMKTGVGIAFMVLLLAVFVASGYVVFSSSIKTILPGGEFYYPRFWGGVLMLVIGAIVGWVLIKFK